MANETDGRALDLDEADRLPWLETVEADEPEGVGIGKVVMREKQYLAAVRAYGKGLALSTMLFVDEVVPQDDIGDVPKRKTRVNDRERKLAERAAWSAPGVRAVEDRLTLA